MTSLIGQDSTSSGFDPGLQNPQRTFGVWGDSGDGDGIIGSSATGSGVFGHSVDANAAAIRGVSLQGTAVDAVSSSGTAVHAQSGPAAGGTEVILAGPSHSGDFRGPVRMTGALEVTGSGTFGENVRAAGTFEAGAGAFSGDVTTTGALVAENITAKGVLDAVGDIKTEGALGVTGTGSFGGDVTTTGGLGISGAGTFGGNVNVTGPLVAGAGSFTGDVTTTGALGADGNITTKGVLDAVGDIKTEGALEVDGTGSFGGDVEMSGGLTVGNRLGVGVTDPTHALHVARVRGIRQNELYLSGSKGWSSLSYNAHHNNTNDKWEFPNPNREAVTIEMDDKGGKPRFEVWSTTKENTTGWQSRFMIDGQTGTVSIPHSLLSVNNDKPAGDPKSATANAVCAISKNAIGVFASGKTALFASGPSTLGGDVHVTGVLTTGNDKRFVIDSPTDPENKTLTHVCVESDERCNVYSGNVVLDDDGTAEVELPNWFCALNVDFRYQLTCIGQSEPVYIAKEVAANAFTIAGGIAGLKVSWQLTGIRDDAWARANALQVEQEKPEEEKGYFLNPEAFGHDVTRHVLYRRNEGLVKRHPRQAEQVIRAFRRGVHDSGDSTATS
ncbi:hypothetical protein [Nocardia sp. bgisy118]|uniref:hypothetical protein n=1 Tax=Nocardia sp. bgisy118 TaxID=3413786 RepID=UPI003F4A8415